MSEHKNLILINGTMGVGKTVTAQALKAILPNSVFLDGDYCWDMDPFVVNEETKAMVLDNICYLLNNFLRCSVYENVIFCWVMHEQSILESVSARLELSGHTCYVYSLICTEEALTARLRRDIDAGIRQEDVLSRSIPRLALYQAMKTEKIDTSEMTPEETAEEIKKRILKA